MDIHEYQAKQLVSKYGVNVPVGEVSVDSMACCAFSTLAWASATCSSAVMTCCCALAAAATCCVCVTWLSVFMYVCVSTRVCLNVWMYACVRARSSRSLHAMRLPAPVAEWRRGGDRHRRGRRRGRVALANRDGAIGPIGIHRRQRDWCCCRVQAAP